MTLDYLAHFRAESARLGDVLRNADPSLDVPTCPDWAVDDLLWHMGGDVFYFWSSVVLERVPDLAGAEALEKHGPQRPDTHASVVAVYDRMRDTLLEALDDVGDDEPMWTWATGATDHTAGFVKRRMAQEALVHRIDAEATVGDFSPVDAELATDGVFEGLQHFFGGVPDWATWSADGPLGRLRTTDTAVEWTVRIGSVTGTEPGSGVTYEDEPAVELVEAGEPTFTVSAPARDLDMWLWNRPTVTDVVVDGEQGDFVRLKAVIASGVQ